MSETFICAIERTERPNKIRKEGYVPAVMYGKEIEGSKNIQFELRKLNSLLKGRTTNANLKVKFNDNIENCIVKEVQKDPVTAKMLHIEVQAVSAKEILKLIIPIVFEGRERLIEKGQLLQVIIPEVEIMGEAAKLPKYLRVNISNREIGDKIELSDIEIDPTLEILDDVSEGFAVITEMKELEVEAEEVEIEDEDSEETEDAEEQNEE